MNLLNAVNDFLWSYVIIAVLIAAALAFTLRTRIVQLHMLPHMVKLLFASGKTEAANNSATHHHHSTVSSFQAFAVSIAGRVGTGNIAGVAIAIGIGGPGSVFWMWIMAFFGAATAFVESTLGQLFKVPGRDSFRGGPAYYILKGMHCRWLAVLFAIIITLTFGLAFNSVQANTIAMATENSFGWGNVAVGIAITAITAAIIWGGIQRISRVSQVVVPVMAVAYLLLATVIIAMNIEMVPQVLKLIVDCAFNGDAAIGATAGSAMMLGIKRGLFSNEAGEGSAPNAAATASTSHPVKQGLIQALGVYTDTFLVCSSTAFIILWSGLYNQGAGDGIVLTQAALCSEVGPAGQIFVTVAVFLFATTSVISNYYYGETNLNFICQSSRLITAYRLCVAAIVFIGSIASLEAVWAAADLFMGLMTLINLTSLAFLGKYAVRCLADYRSQLRQGHDPAYHRSTIPEIASETTCWPE